MLAVAGVADMDLCKLAHHAVAVEFAVAYTARDTSIDVVFHSTLLLGNSMPQIEENIKKRVDKSPCYM